MNHKKYKDEPKALTALESRFCQAETRAGLCDEGLEPRHNLPLELREFFAIPGSLLLVKGTSGTGKTTLSLQAINDLIQPKNALFISPMESEIMIKRKFPWINDKWKKEGACFITSPKKALPSEVSSKFFESVPEVASETWPCIYEMLKRALPKGLIIFDGIAALSKNLNIARDGILVNLRTKVLAKRRINAVVISERPGEDIELDHLCDGIITLSIDIKQGRTLRWLRLDKLRGTCISHPMYLFSLDGGRFRIMPFISDTPIPLYTGRGPVWSKTKMQKGTVSTGNAYLDKVFHGRIKKGTYILFIVGAKITNEIVNILALPAIANALVNGGGAAIIPPLGISFESARKALAPYVNKKAIDERLRFLIEKLPEAENPNQFVEVGREPDLQKDDDRWQKLQTALRSRTDGSLLHIVGFDRITLRYGMNAEELTRYITANILLGRTMGDVGMAFIKRDQLLLETVVPLADVVINIDQFERNLVLWGEKPWTMYYAAMPEYSRGLGVLKLELIV